MRPARRATSALTMACRGALSACALSACVPPPADEALSPLGQLSLVWSDEFDGAAGSPVDPERWTHDVGGDGWGNNQLEHNTDRIDNVRQDGEGRLIIEALIEEYQGNAYTSGRILTKGRFTVQTGRVEARIKLPVGSGLWPAFWMLGADIDAVSWPACGEIDVLEMRGEEPYTALGTVHGPGYSGADGISGEYTLRNGTFADDFHDFAVDIDPGHIAWMIDGEVFHTVTTGDLPEGAAWAFDRPFFLLINLAVGGNFVGALDESALPARVEVEHVRVYERAQ
jgi:beta-glucanase (GH16 family)